MHDESFVLAELGRLYIDSRALVIQLQAAQKRIVEQDAILNQKPESTPPPPSD